MKQIIFLCIDSSPDVLILNDAPLNLIPGDFISVCTPSHQCYDVRLRSVAGNILEIKHVLDFEAASGLSSEVTKRGIYENFKIPPASLVVIKSLDSYLDPMNFFQRYQRGYFNPMIQTVMDTFGVTEYSLP